MSSPITQEPMIPVSVSPISSFIFFLRCLSCALSCHIYSRIQSARRQEIEKKNFWSDNSRGFGCEEDRSDNLPLHVMQDSPITCLAEMVR